MSQRKRPTWMPPPLAFPIIWSTIAVLRGVSSALVWSAAASGGFSLPILAALPMIVHLSVGDTWNTVNNVERRLGAAVPGVLAVALSVYAVVFCYAKTSAVAGYVIAPSALWITIAAVLVTTIWKMNPKPDGTLEPLVVYTS